MLERWYSEPALRLQMGPKSQFFFMAEQNQRLVAYTAFTIKSDGKRTYLYLNKLYSLEAVRGQGIGKALLSKVIAEAQKRGILTIRLNVNRHNPTVAWYLAQGFFVAEEMILQIGMGFVMEDYVMELDLTSRP
jgi:GNAT superfamily N-acetyltransferase